MVAMPARPSSALVERIRNAAATAVAAALLLTTFVAVAPPASASTPDAALCRVAAHRGNTSVPSTTATENGIRAMHRAVAAGADILEADASATADDQMMLMHDATVDRTTNGTGPIRGKTAAKVRALLLDDGSRVPYASQLLAYAQQTDKTVLLELKAMGGATSFTRITNAITRYGQARVIVQSFKADWLTRMRTLLPTVRLSLISRTQVPVSTARQIGGLIGEQSIMTDQYIASLDGIPTYVFTVNTSAGFTRFARHVDAIITDNPGAYVRFRATACAA
jgi:glycerophosphoryl diester phosphodiesterase